MSESKKHGYENADSAELHARAQKVLQDRTGIVLSGRVVNGKVELDEHTTAEIARKFTGANTVFVAVNAPFDPTSRPIVGT